MFKCREINATEEMKMSAKAIEKMQLSDEQLEEVVGGSVAVIAAGIAGGVALGVLGARIGVSSILGKFSSCTSDWDRLGYLLVLPFAIPAMICGAITGAAVGGVGCAQLTSSLISAKK